MSSFRSIIVIVALVIVVAMNGSAQAPDLMYLQFNEGSGTTTADTALPGGLSATPTLTGLAGWFTTSPQLGAAALFLPSTAAAGNNCKTGAPFTLSGDWTIEFWYFGTDSSTTTRYILGDSTSTTPFRLYKTGAANMFFGATNFNGWTLENAYTPNVWTHIAISYDFTAKILTVYKDGVFLEQNSNTSTGVLGITSANGLSIGGAGTSTQFQGAIDDFRLWGSVRSQAQIMSNMNIELMSFSDDVAVESIAVASTGTGCAPLAANEPVGFTIRNVGLNAIPAGTFFTADLVVDAGSPITEGFLTTLNLNSGQGESFTFVATADLSSLGAHTVDVAVAVAGDLNPLNDGLQTAAFSGGQGYVSSFPWAENFDGAVAQNSTIPPFGWQQDQNDATGASTGDKDWYMHTGTTTSSNTGPNGDATTGTGYYAYVEDGGGSHPFVNLISPCLDLSSLIAPQLNFAAFSYNANPGGFATGANLLAVDVISYPGGIVTTDVFGPMFHDPANTGTWAQSSWQTKTVSLAPFAGQTIQLVFRASSDNSGIANTFYHDIAIDDVLVFEPAATPGQAPRPGLAVLDVANARNANFAAVSSGLGGPYFSSITQGSDFGFHFEGESFQPIALVYSALNPVSATYPGGIGQFDIGGPGVDMNGLPLNLAVFANAIGWVQAGAPGFPFDAIFFTSTGGSLDLSFSMPPFGIPAGTVLTTFQAAITSAAAPFVYLSNAVQVTLN